MVVIDYKKAMQILVRSILINNMKRKKAQKTKKISKNEIYNLMAKKLQNGTLNDDEYSIVEQYYSLQAPSKIYRYRPEDSREIKALVENKIWFSALTELNDPFEFNTRTDIESILASENDIQGKMQAMSFSKKRFLLKEIAEEINKDSSFQEILFDFTIACFSEKKDSLLMWGHYSSGHRGICVEYDTMDLNSFSGKTVIPVSYSNVLPAITSTDETALQRLALKLMATKFSDWEYECEWRCIQDKGACGETWTPKGALLDSSPPTAIYLGCKSEGEFVDSLIHICKNALQIPLYKMTKSKEEYKLLPERIV